MTRIADAKREFGAAIEAELDDVGTDLRRLIARAREAGKDCRGLNDLAASYNGLASTLEHALTQVEDARNEARICMVLEVPPILVGAKIGLDRSTMANFKAARREWWEDTLYPMYEGWLDQLESLLKQFDPTGRLSPDWDKSKIYAFNEDYNSRFTMNMTAWTSGLITRAEFRSVAG